MSRGGKIKRLKSPYMGSWGDVHRISSKIDYCTSKRHGIHRQREEGPVEKDWRNRRRSKQVNLEMEQYQRMGKRQDRKVDLDQVAFAAGRATSWSITLTAETSTAWDLVADDDPALQERCNNKVSLLVGQVAPGSLKQKCRHNVYVNNIFRSKIYSFICTIDIS